MTRGSGRHRRLVPLDNGPHPAGSPGCFDCAPRPVGRTLLLDVVRTFEEAHGTSPAPWAHWVTPQTALEVGVAPALVELADRPCPVCGHGDQMVVVGSSEERELVLSHCGSFADGPGCGHVVVLRDAAIGA